MAKEWTIDQIRDFVKKDYQSVSARIVKCLLEHHDRTVDGIKKETMASMLVMPPNDEYKNAYNTAMLKVVDIIKTYEKGDGLFQ